jgi:hypothetical protein
MREFFRGWRRKLGSVTLVMACGLTLLAVRSYLITDIWTAPVFGDAHYVLSGQGAISWSRQLGFATLVSYSHGTIVHPSNRYYKWTKWGAPWEPEPSWTCDWQYGIGYLAVGSHEMVGGAHTRWWQAAHWHLVLPLTLLSAYLILWKPRKRLGGRGWTNGKPRSMVDRL